MKSDLDTRRAVYWSDWTDISSWKILSSSIFIFFTSITPAVTFSLYMTKSTEGNLGAMEILLSTALTGTLFSIFGGQPMVILGVTGPVTILMASIYTLSQQWGLPFMPFLAWAQLWASAMHFLLASGNYCALLRYVTQFSCETFGMLIAWIYLYTGCHGIVDMLSAKNDDASVGSLSLAVGYLQFILAIGCVWSAAGLVRAEKHWHFFHDSIRHFLTDYGATLSIFIWTVVSLVVGHERPDLDDEIPRLFIPSHLQTTSNRSLFVNIFDIPTWGIFAAVFPGVIITVLFFFDHNVSSIMAQHKDFQLQKGSAYHWDFFVLGISVFITGLLGLPPTNGLIPQAPLHTKSLMTKTGKAGDDAVTIYEQRVTNLAQSVLIGLSLLYPFSAILRTIPTAVLYGFFIFLGLASFEDNEFATRLSLFFLWDDGFVTTMAPTPSSALPVFLSSSMRSMLSKVSKDVVFRYTLLQVCIAGIIFASTFTAAGVIFPVLIGLLVVVRQLLLVHMYDPRDLAELDKDVVHEEEVARLLESCSGQTPAATSGIHSVR